MSAICKRCGQDMSTADGCVDAPIEFSDGVEMAAVPSDRPGRCEDCAALPGRHHHLHCDQEVCPRCGGQLLGCSCGEPPETLH